MWLIYDQFLLQDHLILHLWTISSTVVTLDSNHQNVTLWFLHGHTVNTNLSVKLTCLMMRIISRNDNCLYSLDAEAKQTFCKEYTIQLLSQKRTAGETELKLNLFSYFQSSSLLVNVMLQNLKFSLILYQNTSLSFSLCYFKFLMQHVTTFFILFLLSF